MDSSGEAASATATTAIAPHAAVTGTDASQASDVRNHP
jgi:hypothetical protein